MIDPLRLRDATWDDRALLFEWANDPRVREQSFNREEIDWDEHLAWFSARLEDPACVVYIVERGETPIAVARFESDGESATVSFSLAEDWRGQGLATPCIRLAMERACAVLGVRSARALIKPSNAASLAAFRGAGYADHESEESAVCLIWTAPDHGAAFRTRLGWEGRHREILPGILLMHHLRARGIPSTLEHVLSWERIRDGRPQVAVIPFYYDDHDRKRYLRGLDLDTTAVVNLACEQLYTNCAKGLMRPDGAFGRQQIVHCAWGPRHRRLLMEADVAPGQIRVVGNPRFDLYDPGFRSLLSSREWLASRYGLDEDKPWVLVPSSFNLAHMRDGVRRSFNARKYHISDELVAMTKRARESYLELLELLPRRFPDLEWIVRAHPGGYERGDAYARLAATHSNLHSIHDFDVANWITNAALVIVWNSTSALEAMVAGVPAVAYEPEPYSRIFDYDVARIVPAFDRVDAICEVVDALPDVSALTWDWELFEQWHAFRDGRSAERTAGVVAEQGARARRLPRRRRFRIGDAVRSFGAYVRRRPGVHAPPRAALSEAVDTLEVGGLREYLR